MAEVNIKSERTLNASRVNVDRSGKVEHWSLFGCRSANAIEHQMGNLTHLSCVLVKDRREGHAIDGTRILRSS